MPDGLCSFPDATIVLMFAALAAVSIVVLPLIFRPIRICRLNFDHTEFTLRIYGTLFTLCGFALTITAITPAPGRQTTLYAEMLKSLDFITELREERLDSVHVALPSVYWDVVFFAMIVLMVAASAIQRTPFRTLLLAGQAAFLGAIIGVVFITDHPFKGQTSVGTNAMDKAIAMMKARER